MKEFIPIEVKRKRKDETWFLDISNLSLSELIKLKNELIGISEISIPQIDKIIYDEIGEKSNNIKVSYREYKKEEKNRKYVKKFSKKSYNRKPKIN